MNSSFGGYINGSFIYEYPCNDQISCHEIIVLFTPGLWKVECWGASGGDGYSNDYDFTTLGGLGGYSVGVVKIRQNTKAYLYVGGAGLSKVKDPDIKGGFNGGGDGYAGNYYGASGGGGTDIRLISNDIDNRIIIAGGGGGAGVRNANSPNTCFGGYGGGDTGGYGTEYTSSLTLGSGRGGNQTHGGDPAVSTSYTNLYSEGGSKLKGGNSGKITHSASGGGGGGYFGGSGGVTAGGGGGSGYISSTVFSYNRIYAKTLAGSTEFPSPYGTIERGHKGNGVIKITYLVSSCIHTCANFKTRTLPYFIPFIYIMFVK